MTGDHGGHDVDHAYGHPGGRDAHHPGHHETDRHEPGHEAGEGESAQPGHLDAHGSTGYAGAERAPSEQTVKDGMAMLNGGTGPRFGYLYPDKISSDTPAITAADGTKFLFPSDHVRGTNGYVDDSKGHT